MTDEIDILRANHEAAKARAEAALEERERAYFWLRQAEIAAEGCKITGFTVNYCQTCGRDEAEVHKCPHWKQKECC